MKKILCCTSLLLVVALKGAAWGPTGHRVSGLIAERYLSKKAKAAVEKILGGQSLAMASTWMDEVRSDSSYDYMADWHWVTLPPGAEYRQTKKNPNGDILKALQHAVNELEAGELPAEKEALYLKILIHLVVDLHQPLHIGARDDRGGNNVKVWWFGEVSNLHRVWDSEMIDHSRLSYTELAASLNAPDKEQVREWQGSSIYDWARESQSYHEQVYDYGNRHLGYAYAYVNLPTVRQRLLQSGIRLAGILNELYG